MSGGVVEKAPPADSLVLGHLRSAGSESCWAHERWRHSASAFQYKERPTPAQFARGIRWTELEDIEIFRRHDQLRWFIDAKVDDHKLNFSSRAQRGPPAFLAGARGPGGG